MSDTTETKICDGTTTIALCILVVLVMYGEAAQEAVDRVERRQRQMGIRDRVLASRS